MKYFAYGSNMLVRWLRTRAPGAYPLGAAQLRGCELRFHKRGLDGSAKCGIVPAGADVQVHGVLYAIEPEEKPALDRAESLGVGYRQEPVVVTLEDGPTTAFTYVARPSARDESLRPYEWYKELVVAGAVEHGLPGHYVARLRAVAAIPDPDRERSAKCRSVLDC